MALLNTFPLDARSGTSYGFEWLRYMLDAVGIQEGVLGAGDLKVTAAAAGGQRVDVAAGTAIVRGDTGVRNGLYVQVNDAPILSLTLTASNGTNPRLDQIILTVNDSTDLASGSDTPALSVLTGTATAGVTLDNRTGAAALPNNAIRLADVLVPAASGAVTAANVRDRRPWARGAYWRGARTTDFSTASASAVQVDTTALLARIECSGVPVRLLSTDAGQQGSVAGAYGVRQITMDAAVVASVNSYSPATNAAFADLIDDVIVPAAGSHLFDLRVAVANVAATLTLSAGAGAIPIILSVEEILRPSAANT